MKMCLAFLGYILFVSCSHLSKERESTQTKKESFTPTHREMIRLRHGFRD